MDNEETLEHFEETLRLYQELFRIGPEIIACDMHPEYLATKYALELREARPELQLVQVQHHHAHIVSCLAENSAEGPVIGVSFDGTGYGPDGTIWGGEFLIADWRSFERVGHLEHVPLPGGEAAIRRPYRMALAYVLSLCGGDVWDALPPLQRIDPVESNLIQQQVEQRLNSPLTSSAGRLFDAVAALAGVRGEVDYEAQAAIELEMLATPEAQDSGSYPFSIAEQDGMNVVQLGKLLTAVMDDETCQRIAQRTGLSEVALSGGVFQNRLLLRIATNDLRQAGFSVLTHRLVPPNDGGISLGQAVVANFKTGP
jgi:hydrogenase maturation protein HypF